MPEDWNYRWKEFYLALVQYKRNYKTNRSHDAADVITGIVEKELLDKGPDNGMAWGEGITGGCV